MGCYVFQRIEDMFAFFRAEPGEIKPGYWQENSSGNCFEGANL